jgi:hypothetical protein
MSAISEDISKMNAIFKRERGSELTSALVIQDTRRDDALAGISLLLQAYSNHFDTAMRQAAQRLLDHYSSYGSKIYTKSYQQETAIINDLRQEWQNNANRAADVTTLGLDSWLTELGDANTEFDTLYTARASEASEAPDQTMEEARMEATVNYRTLANLLEAFVFVHPELPFEDIIANINSLTNSYNATVEKRSN